MGILQHFARYRPTGAPAACRSGMGCHLAGMVLTFAVFWTCAGPCYAEAISPRRLLEVADLGNPVISPDGTRVAFRLEQASVERNTYDSVWYVQKLGRTSLPLRVADGGTPLREYSTGLVLPAPAVWSPDGRWIYYRALLDGKVAVWRAAADGSRAQQVTNDAADVRGFSLTEDGRTLRYSVGSTREEVREAEQAEYASGIHVDETTFIGAGLHRSSLLEGRMATQRFVGEWFETGPLLAHTPDLWKAIDLTSMEEMASPVAGPSTRTPPTTGLSTRLPDLWKWAQAPGADRIAVLTRTGEKGGRLAKPGIELSVLLGMGSGERISCKLELCRNRNITDIQWRPDSNEVLFTVTDRREGRARSMFLWDFVADTVRTVVVSNGLLGGSNRYWDIPCGLSPDTLVCVAAEADRPPRLEMIDLATGSRHALFKPNEALARDVAAATPARLLRWRDARGREFSGQLFEATREKDASPPPLFVTFYTCDGFLRGGFGDEWPLMSLAEAGISALCINANPGYADVVEHYGQGLSALESVVELLADEGRIDRFRLGMGGLSYGGEATMWTIMHSELLSAASIASPSITPNWYLFNMLREGFRSRARSNWQLGGPGETPEQWAAISPAFNLDRIRAPVLFQIPEQEYMAALEYALPLVRNGTGDLYVFPYAPHIKFQPRQKLAVYERNVDWFRFWLQDHEDPDPSKTAQYKRWREMRDGRQPVASATGGGFQALRPDDVSSSRSCKARTRERTTGPVADCLP